MATDAEGGVNTSSRWVTVKEHNVQVTQVSQLLFFSIYQNKTNLSGGNRENVLRAW